MMRRQRGICLLRRHVFKPNYPVPSSARYASAKSREPYILPRLVIDLDANDNQFVREAKEEDYAVPDKPPRRERYVPKAPEENVEMEVELDHKTPPALDLRAATAADLVQYALLGNPFAFRNDNNAQLRRIFDYLKVHDLDNADSKIKRLTYNFTTDSSKLLEGVGFIVEREPLILEQIRSCNSFRDLRRMISTISSTTEGCKFLAAKGADVDQGIWHCRKQLRGADRNDTIRATSANVLKLLNNLRLNMESKGVALGPDLCNTALYYATKAFCFPSVQTYLRILDENSYGPTKEGVKAIAQMAVHTRHKLSLQSFPTLRMNQEERNREALQLLTGWQSDGSPQPSEKRQLSFASAVVARTSPTLRKLAYSNYIDALGHFGASSGLWYEWQDFLGRVHRIIEVSSDSVAGETKELRRDVEVFAGAFLMTKEPERALQILKAFFELVGNLQTTPHTLSYETYSRILWFYRWNNLAPTKLLLRHLEKFPFLGPEAIFQKLNDMLVPEWVSSRDSADLHFEDRSERYSIDWIEQEGVQGVGIKDGSKKILYFKPSSPHPSSPERELSSGWSRSSPDE